ncbi:MAG: tRNA pseudouridine(13) synthase TruD, partial [Gammaproteobacteria bacterium]
MAFTISTQKTGFAAMQLPRAQPAPLAEGVIRCRPEDFQVEEIGAVDPTGEGEHVWLQVRKQGCNTEQVARALAAGAGVPGKDIGFAGLKDRHAIATQWFSVRLAGRTAPEWQTCMPHGCEVVCSVR